MTLTESSTDCLLEIGGEETIESKRNLYRFYNYVKHLLPNSDFNVMLAASKTLGTIAEIGVAAFGDSFIPYEVSTAISLLHADKQEPGRYAGVLILKELARHSANYIHSHIGLVFDNILVPLRDPRPIVREGAAELLAACLEIVTQRERQPRSPYLVRMLQEAQAGLRMTQPEIIHGSLITYRELLLHGGMVHFYSPSRLYILLTAYQVHEGGFLGFGRTDLKLQDLQGQRSSENGHHNDPHPGRLRHTNILRASSSQSHGPPFNPTGEAQ